MANLRAKPLSDSDADYCPCCNLPANAERFPLCISISQLSELGEGFPLYYHTVRWLMVAFLGGLLIASVYCLHKNYAAKRIGEWDETLEGSMVMESSLANYGKNATPPLLQPWLHVLCMWGLLVLHQYLAQQHKRFCAQMDRNVITPSDYTCVLSGLPATARNAKELTSFVEGLMPNVKVSRVNFAYDIREYEKIKQVQGTLRCKYHKLKHIYETTGSLPQQKRLFLLPGPPQGLETPKMLLDQAESELKQLYCTHEQRFAGIAFVSFEQDESNCSSVAKHFTLQYSKKQLSLRERLKKIFCGCICRDIGKGSLTFQGSNIGVKRAPEPNDIMWGNLGVIATQVTKAERKRRNKGQKAKQRKPKHGAKPAVRSADFPAVYTSSCDQHGPRSHYSALFPVRNAQNCH